MDLKKKRFEENNMLNKNNSVIPNYDISNKQTYFKFYLSPKGELCIIGEKDNNYIVWCSFTHINDKILNKQIFDYVSCKDLTAYSNLHNILSRHRHKEVRCWHQSRITRCNIKNGESCWSTPFANGHSHYGSDTKNNGEIFSSDIIRYYHELIDKSKSRILCDSYYQTLCEYEIILCKSEESHYYCEVKQLISIIKDESYMRICQDELIRHKYLECIEQGNLLYNRYMTAVR